MNKKKEDKIFKGTTSYTMNYCQNCKLNNTDCPHPEIRISRSGRECEFYVSKYGGTAKLKYKNRIQIGILKIFIAFILLVLFACLIRFSVI